MPFSPPLSVTPTRSALLPATKASSTPSLSCLKVHHLCSPVSSLVHRDLGHLSLPQDVTLVYYIDATMLIGPREQEEETGTQGLLIRHCMPEGGKRSSLNKIQAPSAPVKFLGVQWHGGVSGCLLEGRISYCIWLLLKPRRGAMLGGPWDLGGSMFLLWVCCSSPLTKRPRKLLVLSGAQNTVQAAT